MAMNWFTKQFKKQKNVSKETERLVSLVMKIKNEFSFEFDKYRDDKIVYFKVIAENYINNKKDTIVVKNYFCHFEFSTLYNPIVLKFGDLNGTYLSCPLDFNSDNYKQLIYDAIEWYKSVTNYFYIDDVEIINKNHIGDKIEIRIKNQ
jgi:hypothetical protein